MNNAFTLELQQRSIELLKQLIRIPSFSREENGTADVIESFLSLQAVEPKRYFNNVWATNREFDPSKPTLLLNSHHDTVKPNDGYTKDPFSPIESEGKLFGLGSNDAGASLVSLIACFLFFHTRTDLKYNLVLAASAEEEISGLNGIEAILSHLPKISAAIVGEPTGMQMAVAEKGLMVLDGISHGKAGHAAREDGDNALYKAIEDISKIKNLQFDRVSELTGSVKATVTAIETHNQAHNVIPDKCNFVVDVRVNELYTLEEIYELMKTAVSSDLKARSFRLKSTTIDLDHPLVKAGVIIGKTSYGSPTLSDKALMPFPGLKIGPGDSARSHTADEFIYVKEIEEGIIDYIKILNQLL
jgi:acetylornithine deacetylase/succinyl-diaminopimelate desuccinylase-like protein